LIPSVGRQTGKKEGRKGGRKGGREGRKEGRKEGMKEGKEGGKEGETCKTLPKGWSGNISCLQPQDLHSLCAPRWPLPVTGASGLMGVYEVPC
jgi:hypothetical protein